MKRLNAVAALLAGLLATKTVDAKPNILLVIADDAGVDVSRCYQLGEQQALMPTLEHLCETGVVFDNAYSAPVCSPTRATIMTGRYGFRTGIGAPIPKRGGTGLSSDETSLFDLLNTTDYASALIGKWHLASAVTDLGHPADLGVNEYFGMMSGGVPDYFDWQANDNGTTVEVSQYSTTALTDRSIDWINSQQSPWFLWLAYNAPHTPFHLPPKSLHSFDELSGSVADIKANPLPYFQAALESLDTEMGRLLSSLPEDVRENTMVVFIGDNGTPGQVARHLYGDKGAKGSIYEGGTRIPFVVSGPGVDAGRSDALVNTSDLYATIASLAGASSSAADSINMVPVLHGEPGGRRHAYVELFGNNRRGPDKAGWAIRDKQFKLVTEKDQPAKLFDLSADPLETTDLLPNGNDAVQRKAAELLQAATALKQ